MRSHEGCSLVSGEWVGWGHCLTYRESGKLMTILELDSCLG